MTVARPMVERPRIYTILPYSYRNQWPRRARDEGEIDPGGVGPGGGALQGVGRAGAATVARLPSEWRAIGHRARRGDRTRSGERVQASAAAPLARLRCTAEGRAEGLLRPRRPQCLHT